MIQNTVLNMFVFWLWTSRDSSDLPMWLLTVQSSKTSCLKEFWFSCSIMNDRSIPDTPCISHVILLARKINDCFQQWITGKQVTKLFNMTVSNFCTIKNLYQSSNTESKNLRKARLQVHNLYKTGNMISFWRDVIHWL